MKNYFYILIFIIGGFSLSFSDSNDEPVDVPKELAFKSYSDCFYETINDNSLNYNAFEIALKGYFELKAENKLGNDRYLTVVDMSVSANTERFFLIDIYNQTLVYKSLVAHGVATGEEFAKSFSNIESSHQSSLGFYLTGETYNGKHNFSLKLDGLETYNDKARERGIVIHAAEYVSHDFIETNGRLGRSYGCPALPHENYFDIISKIKEKSCFFIYYPDAVYINKSSIGKSTPKKHLLDLKKA